MPLVPRSPGRFISPLLTRQAGILAAVAVLVVVLGCMSISIGKFSGTEADGVFCQEGEVTMAAQELREVFYPVPYAHSPNLEVSSTFHDCKLVSQREGSFQVRNEAYHSVTMSWKARGLRAAPVAVIPAVPAAPELPPPAPVPAESTGKER